MVDIQNKLILPIEYDDVSTPDFLILFEVTKNGLKGMVNMSSDYTIPLIYNEIEE